jgi:phospholipid-translocating ATPase
MSLRRKTGRNKRRGHDGDADQNSRASSSMVADTAPVIPSATEKGSPPSKRSRGHSVVSSVAPSVPLVPETQDEPKERRGGWFGKKGPPIPAPRRTIFVNLPLPPDLLDPSGNPIPRYVRNKVRTSKYTIITFLPKNLYEQFRRVANIFFLIMVILSVFPIFGATNAQIGMLPLVFILGMTAIKDAIEDWRRSTLDNEVNNSATTKLEGWKNVNQPGDSRPFLQRLLGLGPAPGRPSKGVKKLRRKAANAAHDMIVNQKGVEDEPMEIMVGDKEAFPLSPMPSVSHSAILL